MTLNPVYPRIMNEKNEVDGNDSEWKHLCWRNAESKKLFVLTNFTLQMVSECCAIAKKHGFELKGRIPPKEPGVCHFVPRNYATTKTTVPSDFIFSGHPED